MLANIRRPLAASFFGSALAFVAFSGFATPALALRRIRNIRTDASQVFRCKRAEG